MHLKRWAATVQVMEPARATKTGHWEYLRADDS